MAVMLTVEERAQIETAAEALGLSVSEFVRRRSLGHRMPASRTGEDNRAVLATALLRLGVNLNQIAKHMNAGRSAPPHLPELIATIDRHVERLAE
ncbi:plasmid mobilization protein [Jiella avicenniae]|uniref:Plasmid mobilization relaxosome protein MobC n=1 Tax=Jiella avicenniae TaxID=2907202 RepID=A0A9X1P750_9HYPH|nr:plasmid mobilization relaxosome protein MobC [Jiella avicenniae]MCE7030989.1 plasmid mobilization relaxosome protein MobC [Jiella avicenniae]